MYQDYASSFTELLVKDNSRTIHNRNIQLLATELFKVKNGFSPPFMNEIFVELWNPENYPCRFCKRFFSQDGFYNMPFNFYAAYFIILKSHYFVNF